jgi:hypothetical protein
VSAGAVGVTVAQFFLGGGAYIGHFHVKCQVYPGERMIAIDGDLVAFNTHHRYHLQPLLSLRVEFHAHLDLFDAGEHGGR